MPRCPEALLHLLQPSRCGGRGYGVGSSGRSPTPCHVWPEGLGYLRRHSARASRIACNSLRRLPDPYKIQLDDASDSVPLRNRQIPKVGLSLRTGRSEAIDLLRKWSLDKSLVRCQGSLSKIAFSLNGRISSVDDRELRIISDDTDSELVLRFTAEMEFGYADSRVVSGPEKQYESCLVVFFGPVPDEGTPDTIAIAALA